VLRLYFRVNAGTGHPNWVPQEGKKKKTACLGLVEKGVKEEFISNAEEERHVQNRRAAECAGRVREQIPGMRKPQINDFATSRSWT